MQEQAEHLGKLVTGGDFPHLLVYGPPGAGKKTRVLLRWFLLGLNNVNAILVLPFKKTNTRILIAGDVLVEGDVRGWGRKAEA